MYLDDAIRNKPDLNKERDVTKLVRRLKKGNEDFEYYPTLQSQVNLIKKDILSEYEYSFRLDEGEMPNISVLEIGAADGWVLSQLSSSTKLYAVEKSLSLIEKQPDSVKLLGLDLFDMSLIDKEKVHIAFVNPMFREYVDFMVKIIAEVNSNIIYAVLPKRWKSNRLIQEQLRARKASYEILDVSDYLNAERKARVRTELVKIDLTGTLEFRKNRNASKEDYKILSKRSSCASASPRVDAFELWFSRELDYQDSNCKGRTRHSAAFENELNNDSEKNFEDRLQKSSDLIEDKGLVYLLEKFYLDDLNKLRDLYIAIKRIPYEVLKELQISEKFILENFKNRVPEIKNQVWSCLFSRLGCITNKLTFESRKSILNDLFNQDVTSNYSYHYSIDFNDVKCTLDFSAATAHALILYTLKHAERYTDSQLVSYFDSIACDNLEKIKQYKSNEVIFTDRWRYNQLEKDTPKYLLDYRIVADVGGVGRHDKLSHRAVNFLNDTLTIAYNLGFDITNEPKADDSERKWERGKKQEFYYFDLNKNKPVLLLAVRAYNNGNLHLRFNKNFLLRLSVELGRIKGWLRSKEDAHEIFGDKVNCSDIDKAFGSNIKLSANNTLKQLGFVTK